jgi:hypothetical protein
MVGFKLRTQYGPMTLRTLVEEQDRFLDQFKAKEELDSYRKILLDGMPIPLQASTQIRSVVADSIQIDKRNDPPDSLPAFEKLRHLDKEFLGLELDMLRPVPDALGVLPDEDVEGGRVH